MGDLQILNVHWKLLSDIPVFVVGAGELSPKRNYGRVN